MTDHATPGVQDLHDDPDTADDQRSLLEESWTRVVSWILLIGGAIGFVASATLTIEKIELLNDPEFVPSCNFSPILSCGSVMETPQAGLFGFPNPLLGITGFAVAIVTAAGLLAGARFARWYWIGLQIGVTAAVVFIHWLIYQSLYTIGVLCPYCMVVWAVTIPIFLFVTIRNLHAFGIVERSPVVAAIARNHAPILVAWILLIIVLIAIRFWDYWISLY